MYKHYFFFFFTLNCFIQCFYRCKSLYLFVSDRKRPLQKIWLPVKTS